MSAPSIDEVITLDGPAASGKSTVARRVAEALAVPCVSSGLLYRAATAIVAEAGTDPDDAAAVLATLARHRVELIPGVSGDVLRIDGRDLTRAVQSDEVDAVVSRVAAHPEVRAWVGERLREMPAPFVIDGRDMGSVVFPHARHKFYLDASPEVRAARRVGERAADLASVADAIRRRDRLDARQLAPAPDAQHLDTGPLTLDEVVDWVLGRVHEAGTP
ncbi:MAG: (d)CMP kinase [Trueperaceae bacterium]|nr:(d)CMP kinase [Trueperaceae bacterium]